MTASLTAVEVNDQIYCINDETTVGYGTTHLAGRSGALIR
jgi:hypothetical protein